MAPKSLNDNPLVIGDITPRIKTVQKFIKKHAGDFKQEDHDVQLVLEIKTLEADEEKQENTTQMYSQYSVGNIS